MCTPILTLPIARQRDVLAARQGARQVAGLLGFERGQQIAIAAAVFELAVLVYEENDRDGTCFPGALRFQLADDCLQVVGEPAVVLRLQKPLPDPTRALSTEDLTWSALELDSRTPLNLFEELKRQNQDLLHALRELQECRTSLTRVHRPRTGAAA